jgi:hypothetical protein
MRMLALLRRLEVADWSRPTDCSAWTVRDMAGRLLGAAEGFSNPLEMLHQYRKAAGSLARAAPMAGCQWTARTRYRSPTTPVSPIGADRPLRRSYRPCTSLAIPAAPPAWSDERCRPAIHLPRAVRTRGVQIDNPLLCVLRDGLISLLQRRLIARIQDATPVPDASALS